MIPSEGRPASRRAIMPSISCSETSFSNPASAKPKSLSIIFSRKASGEILPTGPASLLPKPPTRLSLAKPGSVSSTEIELSKSEKCVRTALSRTFAVPLRLGDASASPKLMPPLKVILIYGTPYCLRPIRAISVPIIFASLIYLYRTALILYFYGH